VCSHGDLLRAFLPSPSLLCCVFVSAVRGGGAQVSKAAAILCTWVRATVSYKQTHTRLIPIITRAEEKLATVRKKQEDLKKAEDQLARVQHEVRPTPLPSTPLQWSWAVSNDINHVT